MLRLCRLWLVVVVVVVVAAAAAAAAAAIFKSVKLLKGVGVVVCLHPIHFLFLPGLRMRDRFHKTFYPRIVFSPLSETTVLVRRLYCNQ
jgi:hypothetical protein